MSVVSLDETIATAQSTIKNADTMDKQVWRQWVGLLCMPELGISEEDVKTISLYPNNFTVPKPPDIKAIIDLSLFDINGGQLTHKFRSGSKRIYADTRIPATAVVNSPPSIIVRQIPVDVSDDPYSINIGTNGDQVATIVLRYYTYPTDDAGLPLIRQEETLAVIYFLRFMWSLRENTNQSEIQQNEIRWKIEADRVRARKKMWGLTNDKMKNIVKSVWMRGIPNFDFEQF